jgi:hypothetical protein
MSKPSTNTLCWPPSGTSSPYSPEPSVNPAGLPARIQIAHAGEGQWLALVLDDRGTALEAITGSKAAVLAEIRQRHPDLPVLKVPFVREIPPGKAGDLPKTKGT